MRKLKKKNINLYLQYAKTLEKNSKKKISPRKIRIICVASGFAVLAGIYLIMYFQMKEVQDQYDELYNLIYSDAAAEQSVNAERLEYENQILTLISEKHISNIEKIESQNQQTKKLTPDLISTILECQGADTKIKNISYDKGIVFISGEANDVRYASGFVSQLSEKKIFSYISYTGYVRQGDVYVFSATGYFNEDDVKTEEVQQ